jgi:hypothetical protein
LVVDTVIVEPDGIAVVTAHDRSRRSWVLARTAPAAIDQVSAPAEVVTLETPLVVAEVAERSTPMKMVRPTGIAAVVVKISVPGEALVVEMVVRICSGAGSGVPLSAARSRSRRLTDRPRQYS